MESKILTSLSMSASAPEVISKPQRLQDVLHTGPHDDTGADLSKAARAFVDVDVEGIVFY